MCFDIFLRETPHGLQTKKRRLLILFFEKNLFRTSALNPEETSQERGFRNLLSNFRKRGLGLPNGTQEFLKMGCDSSCHSS
jgi:hypothetical protein